MVKSYFEVVIKSSTIISLIVLIISIVKSYFFYSRFNIEFNEYVEFRDLPKLIINDLVIYIPIITLMVMLSVFVYLSPYKEDKYNTKGLLVRVMKYWKYVLLCLFVLISLFCMYKFSLFKDNWSGSIFNYFSFIIPMYIVILSMILMKNIEEGYPYFYQLLGCIIVCIVFYSAMQLGNSQADYVLLGKNDNIRVNYDGELLSKNTGYTYIGQSSRHVFFYSENAETIILKSDKIKSITIDNR